MNTDEHRWIGNGAKLTWKERVRQLKAETYALYLAYRDPRVPWYARVLAAFVVTSVALSVAAGHQALRNLARFEDDRTSSGPAILPVLSPVPGGATIGLGGVF